MAGILLNPYTQADNLANPEHLAKLKEGAKRWNQWRKENPEVPPALGKAKLKGASLRGVNLIRADLRKAKLGGANLTEAEFMWARLIDADLQGADLNEANLQG